MCIKRLVNRWFCIPLLLIALSSSALAGAYIAEYGFGLKPCILCLYQRIPYAIILVLALISLAMIRKIPWIRPALLTISTLAFLAGGFIAFYHVGVEQQWWQGTSDCTANGTATTLEEMRRLIMEAPANCADPALIVLGISMAGWNIFYSFSSAIFCIIAFFSTRQKA